MIKEIYPYLLVALLGAAVHILKELARLEKISENFKLSVWLQKNRFTTLSGIGVTILTIILLWSIKELNWAAAALAGYAGDSLMKTKFPQMQAVEEGTDPAPNKEPEITDSEKTDENNDK